MSSASKSGLTEPRNGKRSEPYTSDKAAVGRDHPSPLVALDHLGDQDMAPRTQPWPSALPRVDGIAKSLPNGPRHWFSLMGTFLPFEITTYAI